MDIAALDVLAEGLLDGLFTGGKSEAFAVHLEDVNMMSEQYSYFMPQNCPKMTLKNLGTTIDSQSYRYGRHRIVVTSVPT